jgi:indole-3-glycerol phosphate synthase/phosphoribosylanthranilate isomerase
LGAAIIGINNRDLSTLAVDLSVTERLAPRVPRDVVVVAESGIESRRDVDRLAPVVDAFLVGSSLMRASDVRGAARELVFGRVKICGLTSTADAVVAREKGATFGGLVFAEGSPRRVSESRAHEIASSASLPFVGVFVNAAVPRVVALARSLGLSAVQLHGDENAAYVEELRATLPAECAIWHAAHVGSANQLVADPGALRASDRIVFDTASPDVRGGTGRSFDWDIVASHERIGESLLAGGIGPDNAVRARSVGAYAMDVSSRVELSAAKKDPALLQALFDNLRGEGRTSIGGRHARA